MSLTPILDGALNSNDIAPSATMQPLDTFTFPLSGASLIEASAGTGKTYTIVNLYIRLLLGHGCEPLGVEQILVVTFTNAATGELKERIRQRLRKAYLDFFARVSKDAFIQQLIYQSDNVELDCQRLALASKQMDEAAVYTIHGFCHKALTEHAFESGAMYEQSFILDESEWLKLAAEDYWRKHVVTLPQHTLQLLLKHWATPDAMIKGIGRLLSQHATPHHTKDIDSAIKSVNQYAQQVTKLKRWWLSNDVSLQLSKANLNGRAKLGKLPTLQDMQAFCKSDLLQIDFDKTGWQLFSPEQIAKAAKKGSEDVSHLDFSQFEQLQSMLLRCQQNLILAFSQHAMSVVSANLKSHKDMLHLLSPDDLLTGLQRAISQQAGTDDNTLANSIRQNYPAALIDEFQDTDPVQFEVFQGIYGASQQEPDLGPSDKNSDESSFDNNSNLSIEIKQVASSNNSSGTFFKDSSGTISKDSSRLSKACWIMIGDPKQAIYAFRGADIFTYIKAKEWVDNKRHFTLATNWRSAPKLVNGINQLFENSRKGFLFEQSIPFYPVKAGQDFEGLTVQGKVVESLDFQHLCSSENLPIPASDASNQLAIATANQISHWLQLAQTDQAQIKNRAITAGDCCVLVRNRNEAQVIKNALSAVNVASVFLARKSVFATQIAADVFRLLKALSQPTDERLLKAALMSELFTFNAQHLDTLFNDESSWQDVLEQRFYWHQTWQKQGLIRAINQVLQHFNVEQGLIKHLPDGLRRVTDLRHLTELLQQQSLQLVGEAQLIHWFESCLLEPDHNSDNQQVRLESDANLVQIITLHSSKGLEFPLVFIPFASSYKTAQQALYHNDEQQLEVDFLIQEQNLQKADFERLAEDIRLFYVAVTRAVYYCSIGVWNISLGKSKKVSGFTQSALGCLLLSAKDEAQEDPEQSITDQHIAIRIQALAAKCDLSYRTFTQAQIDPPQEFATQNSDAKLVQLKALQLKKPVNRAWRLTSYSAISSQQVHLDMPAPGQDEGQDQLLNLLLNQVQDEALTEPSPLNSEMLQSPFSFERGANAGSFLHGVLENIDLQKPEQLADVITQQSTWFGIGDGWHDCLENWLTDVLLSPFNARAASEAAMDTPSISLSQLSVKQVKVEMEFHMPLHEVKVGDFNRIINQYFKHHARDYQFEQLNGMIKGFIDLMFEYDGKFYVADYKSNHLGDSYDNYHYLAMEQAMTGHDYHLQAILYTLALHRWLKHKLPNYDYNTHVGGAYYLFIRGMSQVVPGNGVYFVLPEKAMIEALDDLFLGKPSSKTLQANKQLQSIKAPQPQKKPQQQRQLDLW
ncbi:UvrD-helicase domain-containing protein [uncultured Paraglaciecola sp.]|uniref:UvrD-helicase domain-containing protein n=1 Tax=uncultured Paraglaciecola sp. TaxID=1765024 RepID=UPI002613433A|nr:UvrD-helicase domain-containing protein [uncultured Paraglaciecola sp.]